MFGFLKERDDKINLDNYTITTVVGADTVVEGTIITKSSVRIDGTLIGGVSAEGVVILSRNGKIKGNIMAENIVVAGVVEGNMQIREKVNVEPTGEIYGDITTKSLLIDEESVFQGNCYMNREVPENGGRGKKKPAKSEKIVAPSEAAAAAMGRLGMPGKVNGNVQPMNPNADEEISLRPNTAPLDDDDIDFVEV
ncbi:MAG: polymer-forming cytoskeletal protein [Lachnospiraceae bacterium]|nr:polymer-forming cytoskeletal protein [Lachnospiraceae bacterium]